MPVEYDPPADRLDDDFPPAHDRAAAGLFNTGVQTRATSPLRRGETLDIPPDDAAASGLVDGERVSVGSRRGEVEAPSRIDGRCALG